MDLPSRCRRTNLGPVATNEMWAEIYDRIAALIQRTQTTLVFVNTRRLAERVAHHLAERLGEDAVLRITAASRASCGSTPKSG